MFPFLLSVFRSAFVWSKAKKMTNPCGLVDGKRGALRKHADET